MNGIMAIISEMETNNMRMDQIRSTLSIILRSIDEAKGDHFYSITNNQVNALSLIEDMVYETSATYGEIFDNLDNETKTKRAPAEQVAG